MTGFDFSDFLNFIPDMEKTVAGIKSHERTAVKLAGQAYESDVKRVIQYQTGTLRRSIHTEVEMEGLNPVALVGTDAPYARRLEYGFIDEDSLGRTYHQAPAARWRPTYDNNLRKYEDLIKKEMAKGGTA